MTGQINREAPANGNCAGRNAFRLGWMVFMVLATSAPYLFNFSFTPAGCHYTWIVRRIRKIRLVTWLGRSRPRRGIFCFN